MYEYYTSTQSGAQELKTYIQEGRKAKKGKTRKTKTKKTKSAVSRKLVIRVKAFLFLKKVEYIDKQTIVRL